MVRSDDPYSLADAVERGSRLARIHEPHIADLTALVDALRHDRGPEYEIPYFDPCDGGVDARVLVLLEAPGPKAKSSGFVSRNNPDPTAKNFFELFGEAGLSRTDTVTWNVVPWYVGDGNRIRATHRRDFDEARNALEDLLFLLPRLKAIVLLGKKAQQAFDRANPVAARSLHIGRTHHPSARVLNLRKERRGEILHVLREVADMINGEGAYSNADGSHHTEE